MNTDQDMQMIPAPRARELFGISAMTLWRWQKQSDFPKAKLIRGRKYFRASEIRAWTDGQQNNVRVIPKADAGRTKGRGKSTSLAQTISGEA